MRHKADFQRSRASLNSEFSFPLTSYKSKPKKANIVDLTMIFTNLQNLTEIEIRYLRVFLHAIKNGISESVSLLVKVKISD